MFNLNKRLTSLALLMMTSIGATSINISSISAQSQPTAESNPNAVTTTSQNQSSNNDQSLRPSVNEQLYLISPAKGVQIYQCQRRDRSRGEREKPYKYNKYKWQFEAPEAVLYDRSGSTIGKHYGGPTWEGNDGSKVIGKVKASVDYGSTASFNFANDLTTIISFPSRATIMFANCGATSIVQNRFWCHDVNSWFRCDFTSCIWKYSFTNNYR